MTRPSIQKLILFGLGLSSFLSAATTFTFTYTQHLPAVNYDPSKPVALQPTIVWTAVTNSFPGYGGGNTGAPESPIPFTTGAMTLNDDAIADRFQPATPPHLFFPSRTAVIYSHKMVLQYWRDPVTSEFRRGWIYIFDGPSMQCLTDGPNTVDVLCVAERAADYFANPHIMGHFDPGKGWAPDTLAIAVTQGK